MFRGPRDVPSSIQGAPTYHLPGSLISPCPPPVCHPVAAEPSLSNSNHCLCQLTSSGRIRQMWGHQCCPDSDCFLSTVRMWAPSCRYGVPAVCLPVCLPDTLNPDPMWRAQHLNSQETFCFSCFLLTSWECFRAKRETPQTGKDTLWIHLHTLETLLHGSKVHRRKLYARFCDYSHLSGREGEGRSVHEMNGNVSKELLLLPDIIGFEGSCCDTGV